MDRLHLAWDMLVFFPAGLATRAHSIPRECFKWFMNSLYLLWLSSS